MDCVGQRNFGLLGVVSNAANNELALEDSVLLPSQLPIPGTVAEGVARALRKEERGVYFITGFSPKPYEVPIVNSMLTSRPRRLVMFPHARSATPLVPAWLK